jgi:hypothetical protein
MDFTTTLRACGFAFVVLGAIANVCAAFIARPLEAPLEENFRELTHVLESALFSAKSATAELKNTLHSQGRLSGRDILVPIDSLAEGMARQHQTISEFNVLDFSKPVNAAARSRLWLMIGIGFTLLGVATQATALLAPSAPCR